jgi:PAT family beta-lactamase induction signal transducer AmpG
LRAAILLLAVIGLYRVSDIVLGVVANIFYQDMGFSKIEIITDQICI